MTRAIGTDTGGSVRFPAACTGIVGFKPSYGLISRWGVIAYANSLDTVGILAGNVEDARKVFKSLQRSKDQDPTLTSDSTLRKIERMISKHVTTQKDSSRLRIGVPCEYNTHELQTPVREAWSSTLKKLLEAGHSIHPIHLPATRLALSAYYVLAPAEASSNLAKYDGIRYGNRAKSQSTETSREGNVLFSKTRGSNLGEEVRRRILLGAYSLSAGAMDNYFLQAQKVRRLVQGDFDNVFAFSNPLTNGQREVRPAYANDQGTNGNEAEEEQNQVDVIIAPTAQSLPPRQSDLQDDPIDEYGTDVLTVPASLAGLPAINVPVPVAEQHQVDATPFSTTGMQIIGQVGTDDLVLKAASIVEDVCGLSKGPLFE